MKYDIEYYEKMLREYSATAMDICRKRWGFIGDFLGIGGKGRTHKVLDYGSGVGWFRAWRPRGAEVWSYDIASYPQTGFPIQKYDVVCFWDVLEHVPDFSDLEGPLRLSDHVALSLPIPTDGLEGWKHFKPGEHLHYFTRESLMALFAGFGFEMMVMDDKVECPPRVDILSALFKRKE